jgi:hypothetical protein
MGRRRGETSGSGFPGRSDLEATLRRAAECLGGRGARFAVVEGLAVSAWTEPRLTRDADFCVVVRDDVEAQALVHGLREDGCEVLALGAPAAAGRLATARLADTRSAEGRAVVASCSRRRGSRARS